MDVSVDVDEDDIEICDIMIVISEWVIIYVWIF